MRTSALAAAVGKVRAGAHRLSVWPAVGFVRFGSLRRTTPIAPIWPPRHERAVDRVYIDRFLESHLIRAAGDVLEVGGLEYTNRFADPAVTTRSTLHAPVGAPANATYVCDLALGDGLPSEAFDVIVLPQTLLFIYDVRAAVTTLHRALRPGGLVLASIPGITPIVPDDRDRWGQYWSFTVDSVNRLFGDVFGLDNIEVHCHGNVKTSIALLHGLAVEDLRSEDFDQDDPRYPLIITVAARRCC